MPRCPACGEDPKVYEALSAREAIHHHFRRVIWHLHACRQAAEAAAVDQMSAYLSGLLHDLEEVYDRLFEEKTH